MVFPDRGASRTACGMWHDFVGPDAYRLDVEEGRMVQEVQPHVDYVCDYVRGWRVEIHPESNGKSFPGYGPTADERWAGAIICPSATLIVANADWADNAYRHEFLHILECPMTDNEHARWSWQWDVE
jgi:hypothetical protein